MDNRTRHEHRLLDGQICPNGKKFRVEGMEIEYPGDPTAPGRLVYNCRCTLIADIEGVDGTVKNRHSRLNGKSYEQWKYELKNNNSGTKTLQNGGKNGIINSNIEKRNGAKGKPQAVAIYDVGLNKRQESLLNSLQKEGDEIVVAKNSVNMKDLSALTAKTGAEYAMFTNKSERLVIRGNSTSVNVDENMAKKLSAQGYKWSGHTHPGSDYNVKIPSDGDMRILKAFNQHRSVIYDSFGRFHIFEV